MVKESETRRFRRTCLKRVADFSVIVVLETVISAIDVDRKNVTGGHAKHFID